MAMIWSWAFGNETQADLESIGFTFSTDAAGSAVIGPASSAVDPLNAYTYSGSPTRYSWEFDSSAENNNNRNQRIYFPAPAIPNNKGIVAIARRAGSPIFGANDRSLLRVEVANGDQFEAKSKGATGTVELRVDGQFKGTSAAIDASKWNYFALVFDCSASPFTGALYINGNLEASGSDVRTGAEPYTIDAIYSQTTQSGSLYGTNLLGQMIVYDDPVADLADAVSPDNFVTRVLPNANGSTVGAWQFIVASGTDGATDPFNDTLFQSASASFTSTIGPVGPVAGFNLTIGATTVPVNSVTSDTFLAVGTGLGTGLTGQTYSVQNTNLSEAVSPPIDNTTYLEIASPSPGDRFDLDAGSDLQTLLGINPSSIKGATVHSVSLATTGTAKIGIGEGGSELLGPADPIQTSDTYTVQSYPNNPNGSTQATGTITIVTTPLLIGDTITIGPSPSPPVLTAVDGTRTPGSDNFSRSGSTTDIRNDLLAAINDPLNSFTEIVEATAGPASNEVTLTATANYSGTAGNSILTAESTGTARITVSGVVLSGGTDSAWVGADQPTFVYEIDTV